MIAAAWIMFSFGVGFFLFAAVCAEHRKEGENTNGTRDGERIGAFLGIALTMAGAGLVAIELIGG